MTKPHGVNANIRAEMARRGKRQTELAELLGISQSGASNRLLGKTPFSVDDLTRIAAWLDVPAASLLSEDVAA